MIGCLWRYRRGIVRFAIRLIAALVFGSLLIAGGLAAFAPKLGDVVTATSSTRDELELSALAVRSIVYARDGSELAVLHGEENRSPVALADVPDEVVDTILAVEDEEFVQHGGVNLAASVRALFENVSAGEIEQGGSTVTMQLVKNLILTPERDINRKVKEIILAVQLEREMSKDEILELYLNTVYFGGGAYGVQAAAEIYWQKSVGELGWSEAALLAALIRNPVGYDPVYFPQLARERRSVVFDRLVSLDLITETEVDQLEADPLPDSVEPVLPPPEDYFVEEVKEQLLDDERLGATYQERENAVFRGGLQIYTTIDPVAQRMAEQAQADIVGGFGEFTAAIVGVEPSSGAVRVMVGGPGFESFQYNIATREPGRQTGSAFKTFVLLAALENGYVPNDRLAGGGDFPNPGGEPNPYTISGAAGTIRSITTASSNGAFVRLGQIVGLDEVVETARRMGVSVPLDPSVISLPLGVFEVPLIEMAGAFAPVAYGGIRQEPYLVERIEDSQGNILFSNEPNPTRAVSRQSACLATEILNANTLAGTGTRARIPDQPVAGKTGTTDEKADALFVGFSPYLVTGVWMGAAEARVPMNNVGGIAVFGGTYPAQMFSQFMAAYHEALPVIEFPECEPTRAGQFIKLGNESQEDSEGARGGGDGGGGDGGGGGGDGDGGGEDHEGNDEQAPPTSAATEPEPAPPTTAPPAPPTTAAPPPPPTTAPL